MKPALTLLSDKLNLQCCGNNCFIIVLTNYPINKWLLWKSIKILADICEYHWRRYKGELTSESINCYSIQFINYVWPAKNLWFVLIIRTQNYEVTVPWYGISFFLFIWMMYELLTICLRYNSQVSLLLYLLQIYSSTLDGNVILLLF